jgi:tetratricopeptide (TPR) repeat protein
MESLKSLLFILFLAASLTVNAQYSDQVLNTFKNSYVLEKSGEFKKAAALLKENYLDDSYEFNLRLGWIQYNAGIFEESVAYYSKALSLLPYSEEARFGLILPLTSLGRFNVVINIYQQILENSPGNTVALYRLGLVYFARKEWALAQGCFQKVVDLYPFAYDGLLMLARTDLQLGKKREALMLFNKVILYNPGDASALEGIRLLQGK